MISNVPLERLLTAVVALDGLAVGGGHEAELRCLMRKIDWLATEAESAVKRCTLPAPIAPAAPVGPKDAAQETSPANAATSTVAESHKKSGRRYVRKSSVTSELPSGQLTAA